MPVSERVLENIAQGRQGGELGPGLTARARKIRIEYAGAAYNFMKESRVAPYRDYAMLRP